MANIFPSDPSDSILTVNLTSSALGHNMADHTPFCLAMESRYSYLGIDSSLALPWLTVPNPDKQDKEGLNILLEPGLLDHQAASANTLRV